MKKFLVLTLALFISFPACAAERIVAIGGDVNEIISALREEKRIIGNDITSTYPESINNIKKVGYARNLSAEGILSLKPDLIILNKEAGPEAVVDQLKKSGVKVEIIKERNSIHGVKNKIEAVAELFGQEKKGKELIKHLEEKMAEVEKITDAVKEKKKVIYIMQHAGSAPIVAGKKSAAESMIELAGADSISTSYYGYKPLNAEELIKMNPEIILVSNETLKHVGGLNKFMELPGIKFTAAGKNKKIINMDALLLLGFGPRTGEAVEELYNKING